MPEGSAWSRFKADLRDVRERYMKQTSAEHKRLVLLLILIGAVVRVLLMLRPITSDEALAYMTFARQPMGGLLSDFSLPSNNLLHTLLMKWSTGIFGVNVVAMRLPALIAGLLCLPFYYLFVRAMFNRYIAVVALALAAAFPAQAELGAMAHGYSFTWLALSVALVLGRHLAKENNLWTAVFLGIVLALGVWAHPSGVYAALLVLFWLLFSLLGKYERSLTERLVMLGIAAAVFVAATALCYLPVMATHGIDHLLQHVIDGRLLWKAYQKAYPDHALAVWTWLTDPVGGWFGLLGFIAIVHAAYISAKFRMLLIAMILGAVPLALVLHGEGQPFQWSYTILVFHLGSAIGLFYLLKFIQDHLITAFAKRTRTLVAALVLVTGCGAAALFARIDHSPYARLPEAAPASDFLASAMVVGDRICAPVPWDQALRFGLLSKGVRLEDYGACEASCTVYMAAVPQRANAVDEALLHCAMLRDQLEQVEMVRGWPGLEIFAARKR